MTKQSIKIIAFAGILFFFNSCEKKTIKLPIPAHAETTKTADSIVIDCNYSFEEAVGGSNAPREIIEQLELIDVEYTSLDGHLHRGQILTNKKMTETVRKMFEIMLKHKFPVAKAIPVVQYDNDDEKSMEANNSYSFCYRNTSYSKHSLGMAIDINPFFNPVRHKPGTKYRATKPDGAIHDIQSPGTFFPSNPVVEAFCQLGLKWGHNFSNKYDDHHFEMRGNPFRSKYKNDSINTDINDTINEQ